MTRASAINALKTSIPRAWHAFLARFNTPTPVQLHGIPSILEGHPVLLIAPTASGKTETYAAPIAEKILAGPGPAHLSAWLVSPTRALVNDLARRLGPPLSTMGLRIGRRTGEHREISGARPPDMVVTTPESLDSILARTPRTLLQARFLVLDEVHMVDSAPRGDQLACLVSRTRCIVPNIQVIASSATVDDPAGLASRYLGSNFKRIQIPGDRAIEADFIDNSAGSLSQALKRLTAKGQDVRKVLVFVQRRADAERLFSIFRGRPPFGDSVFLHHGSLSRFRRESVERRMLTGISGLCFATTTLEVGIDIGDIDLVVLASPPPDVSALLQRIGRGGRRTRATRVCCLASDQGQIVRYEHLIEAARKGRLLGGAYYFCPSVLVQQCMSLLMQTPNKWITAKALASRMPAWLKHTGWAADLPELLDHLSHKRWLIAKAGKYTMGERLEEAFESGLIHSNIEDTHNGIEVVDQDTRRVLGTVPRLSTDLGPMMLSGRRLKVSKSLSGSRVLVTDTRASAELNVMTGRTPVIQANVARDLARFLGFSPNQAPVVWLEDGTFALFHFMGSLWGALLQVLLKDYTGITPIGANAFCLRLGKMPQAFPPDLRDGAIQATAMKHWVKLRRRILEGGWAKTLPANWRRRHLMVCLDIGGFTKTLRAMVVQETTPSSERHNALIHLASLL